MTRIGIVKLAQMDTLEDLFLPAAKITQEDLLRIIAASRHLNRIYIDEPAEGQFDAPVVRRATSAKNIEVYIFRDRLCAPL